MSPVEIKSADLDIGQTTVWLDDDFAFEEPFLAVLTVALGQVGEDSSSYYECLIASPDRVHDDSLNGYNHLWITRRIDARTVRAKLAELVRRANMSPQPLLEAAKYLRWENSQQVLGPKGHAIDENLSREFFFEADAK